VYRIGFYAVVAFDIGTPFLYFFADKGRCHAKGFFHIQHGRQVAALQFSPPYKTFCLFRTIARSNKEVVAPRTMPACLLRSQFRLK
jgi:hypothetical protein